MVTEKSVNDRPRSGGSLCSIAMASRYETDDMNRIGIHLSVGWAGSRKRPCTNLEVRYS